MREILDTKARAFTEGILASVAKSLESNDDRPLETELEDQIITFLDEMEELFPSAALKVDHKVTKVNKVERKVWGWFSVASINGQPVVDVEGDMIDIATLQKAAHAYLAKSRKADEMHDENPVGELVDSIVLTKDVQAALGIDLGMEGWFGGYHVTNDAAWEKVEKGIYRGFSIGGSAIRHIVAP